jgi:ribosomal-protein-alanine N-acetyltransferase
VGERVFLRRPLEADLPAFVGLVEASREFHREWEPWVDVSVGDRFHHMLDVNRRGTSLKLFVCRKADGVVLGMMNVNNIVRGVAQMASLGYWIGAPYARQGYSGEALRLVVRHAFETMALHRVEANIRPENTASIALVRRAGFRKEGYSPRYLKIAGDWRDHERWALLSDEPN